MNQEIKFILGDIQKEISSTYSKDINKPLINEALLYDLVFFIEGKTSFKDNNINGVKISVIEFTTKFNLDKTVINRHLDWLIDNCIIWRNKLSFNMETNLRDAYRYDINWNLKITNYDRFVFITYKDFNELKYTTPVLDTITKSNIYTNLLKIQVDLEKALHIILNLNNTMEAKTKQSRLVYQLVFNKYTISQKNIEGRIFHSITSLNKNLHSCLYVNGIQVSEIDARQSQLFLLSLFFNDLKTEYHSYIRNNNLYADIISYLQTSLEKLSLIENKNVQLKIYDDTLKKTVYINYKDINKDIIKPQVYAALFSGFNNRAYNPVTEWFEIHFPELVEHIKLNYPKENSLASKLQKLEASIWVSAFNKLAKENIFCTTKHDALLYIYPNEQSIIKEVIHQFSLKGLNINNTNFNNFLSKDSLEEIFIKKNTPLQYFDKPELNVLEDFKTELNQVQKNIKILNGCTDSTIFNFKNDKLGLTFEGTKSDFYNKFNLDKKNLNKVIKGIKPSISGWSLIKS